jgi:FkbM family methyltransferase
VGFIKIDVEGHELAVINGATTLLTTQRPLLLIEIEARHHRLPRNDRYY